MDGCLCVFERRITHNLTPLTPHHITLSFRSGKYHKVEKRYREAKIKCDTTHMAMEDLHNYHKALDRALMRYHKMKARTAVLGVVWCN